eukprot:6756786-Pyramimonas_sp.AAC.1
MPPRGGAQLRTGVRNRFRGTQKKERDVWRAGREDNDNFNRVEGGAGACGLDWGGVDVSRVSGGGGG